MKSFPSLFALVLALSVAGCQTLVATTFLRNEEAGLGYHLNTLRWDDGDRLLLYTKSFESNGMLGLCGYAVSSGGLKKNFDDAWVRGSTIHIRDMQGKKTSVSGAFLYVQNENAEGRYKSSCIETAFPYADYAGRVIVGPDSIQMTL